MTNLYELLLKRGLTTSQRDFSTRWCGRSPSYLATQRKLSLDAAVTVLRRLIAERRWMMAARVARMVLFHRGQR